MTSFKRTLWSRAEQMAAQTPPDRNRYVDFLRALSILAVVIGHWLVAAPYMLDGAVKGGHLLGILPWTQWLTWGFQVMPIFFLVGGFSNAASWTANQRGDRGYSAWFVGRLQRLVQPVLPLFLLWTLVAMFGTVIGVERGIVKMSAQLALIPVWFLSVYLMVAALVPYTHALWRRLGLLSCLLMVGGAVIVDVARLHFDVPYIHFLNFGFVWLAIHQLGYAWHEGYFTHRWSAIGLALGGVTTLAMLIRYGPYPIAMIGVPGEPLSNSMPPTLALLALGTAQTGLALTLEPLGRRMLQRLRAWASVILINGMIMTIYLWHLTAFVLVLIASWLMGGVGLNVAPGSSSWWLLRPLWFALYIGALIPLVTLFARHELKRGGAGEKEAPPVALWRLIVGLILICAGLGASAAFSIASPMGITGVRLWIVALPFVGAALIGFGPFGDVLRASASKK